MATRNSKYFHLILLVILVIPLPAGAQENNVIIIESSEIVSADTIYIFLPASRETVTGILILLPDRGWNSKEWNEKGSLQALADTMSWIVACPGSADNSWYLNSPEDTQSRYAEYFESELYPAIQRITAGDTTPVYISGQGMGGYGALNLFLEFPTLFEGAGAVVPVLDLSEFSVDPDNMHRLFGTGFSNRFLRYTYSITPRLGAVANTAKPVHIVLSYDMELIASWKDFVEGCETWNIPMHQSYTDKTPASLHRALRDQLISFTRNN